MSAEISRVFRLLALLTFFLVGTVGHEVTMASDAISGSHVGAGASHVMAQHDLDEACGMSGCHEPGPACCVLGQCLLAILPAGLFAPTVPVLPDPEAWMAPGGVAGVVRAPFRPPAAV